MQISIDPHGRDDRAEHDEGDQRRRADLEDEAGDDRVDRRDVRIAEQRLVGTDRAIKITGHSLVELESDIAGGEEQRKTGAERWRAGDCPKNDCHQQDVGDWIEQGPDISARLRAEARRHFPHQEGADDADMGGEIAHNVTRIERECDRSAPALGGESAEEAYRVGPEIFDVAVGTADSRRGARDQQMSPAEHAKVARRTLGQAGRTFCLGFFELPL